MSSRTLVEVTCDYCGKIFSRTITLTRPHFVGVWFEATDLGWTAHWEDAEKKMLHICSGACRSNYCRWRRARSLPELEGLHIQDALRDLGEG